MSTRAFASAVFPLPVEKVWAEIRNFTFPAKLIPTIESCTMEGNASPNTVGAVRVLKWKTGETRKDQLLELSDQYRTITWELIESTPESEHTASISSIKLYRISEHNHTLVEWSSDYSADVSNDFILFNQNAFLQNLKDMRTIMTK
eukprot:TRINITY_DN93_c0_g1_i1.p1 TRINITY_DN93_c0_g1~~TRINITY_DN93_c0_g1_i1.p1  ORF type:complete len:146 (+),score=31.59 TRINITY_DN93_c0_g1_i1:316-753(+)